MTIRFEKAWADRLEERKDECLLGLHTDLTPKPRPEPEPESETNGRF